MSETTTNQGLAVRICQTCISLITVLMTSVNPSHSYITKSQVKEKAHNFYELYALSDDVCNNNV